MTGIITDIQRFSLHDGAGIRSTVFLKGCNMRCEWCHNPETLSPQPQEAYYPSKCIHCGHCKTGCPAQARVMIGREVTAGDVLAEVLPDRDYYLSSGGGITVSGGEPFVQGEFLYELLRSFKDHGLETAVETNLSLPWPAIEKCLPLLDHVYFDIKLMDEEEHRRRTGISNRTVLENARKLAAGDVPFTVRTPLIPGITDSDGNIRAIAAFLAGLRSGAEYELLNYNVLAMSKYEPIGLSYSLPDTKPLSRERLTALSAIAAREGVNCRIRKG